MYRAQTCLTVPQAHEALRAFMHKHCARPYSRAAAQAGCLRSVEWRPLRPHAPQYAGLRVPPGCYEKTLARARPLPDAVLAEAARAALEDDDDGDLACDSPASVATQPPDEELEEEPAYGLMKDVPTKGSPSDGAFATPDARPAARRRRRESLLSTGEKATEATPEERAAARKRQHVTDAQLPPRKRVAFEHVSEPSGELRATGSDDSEDDDDAGWHASTPGSGVVAAVAAPVRMIFGWVSSKFGVGL